MSILQISDSARERSRINIVSFANVDDPTGKIFFFFAPFKNPVLTTFLRLYRSAHQQLPIEQYEHVACTLYRLFGASFTPYWLYNAVVQVKTVPPPDSKSRNQAFFPL
jgi:hypothetical protein